MWSYFNEGIIDFVWTSAWSTDAGIQMPRFRSGSLLSCVASDMWLTLSIQTQIFMGIQEALNDITLIKVLNIVSDTL